MSYTKEDFLLKEEILKHTKTSVNITLFDEIDSTNEQLKKAAKQGATEGTVYIARSQTDGRGRYARHFYSPENTGIYMSILLRPTIPATDSVSLTAAAAVAVCEALEALTESAPQIKWVNDILINGKKVGGILTEGALNSQNGNFDWAVLGVGLNIYTPENDFADEIKNIAGAVCLNPQTNLKNKLCAEIINRFFGYYIELKNRTFFEGYNDRLCVLGQKITVIHQGENLSATAIDINEKCELTVRYDNGKEETLNSGEISIKI